MPLKYEKLINILVMAVLKSVDFLVKMSIFQKYIKKNLSGKQKIIFGTSAPPQGSVDLCTMGVNVKCKHYLSAMRPPSLRK